jgi:LysR family transcriptional regulator (chromosome initiation inhibitor)
MDFLTAVRLGLGWGMLPELQGDQPESTGELVDLDPAGAIDVVLHWQQWKLRSASLDAVADAVLRAAQAQLR